MMNELPRIWTPQEIAQHLRTTVEAILEEVEKRNLPAFRIGNEIRVTEPSLVAFMNCAGPQANPGTDNASGVIAKISAATLKPKWTPINAFDYKWPDGKIEHYFAAYETKAALSNGDYRFIVGYTNRTVAGIEDRARAVVFIGSNTLTPLVEFVGGNDFSQTQRVVSIIKDAQITQVRSLDQLPQEYQGFPTAIYSEVVVGPYAARSVAVVADYDDRDLMLRHALIRAKYKQAWGYRF